MRQLGHRFRFIRQGLLVFVLSVSLLLPVSFAPLQAAPPNDPTAQTSLWLPLVQSRDCGDQYPTSPFGVQLYSRTGKGSLYFNDMRELGVGWIRVVVNWSLVEPTNTDPSGYSWWQVDNVLSGARHNCFNILATITHAPDWATSSPEGPLDKVGLEELAEFVVALAERYDGDGVNDAPGSPTVRFWELYNEPDAGPTPFGEGWGKHGDKYAEMLKAVYPAVKTANPDAQVVFGGIAYEGFDDDDPPGTFVRSFVSDVLKAGGGDYFDYMNFHKYPGCANCDGPGVIEKTATIRGILAEHGVSKPMIISETGWHNNHLPPYFPGNDELQSRFVVKLFTQIYPADVDVVIWFMMHDLEGYQFLNGLVDGSNPPGRKPAFYVFRRFTQIMRQAVYMRTWSDAESGHERFEVYEFFDQRDQKPLLITWLNPINWLDPNEVETDELLTIPASQVTVTDIYGASKVVRDADDGVVDQKTIVPVNGRPLYIKIDQP
jgi:hypothetical protein